MLPAHPEGDPPMRPRRSTPPTSRVWRRRLLVSLPPLALLAAAGWWAVKTVDRDGLEFFAA
jgi:hypothetical protein